MVVTAGMALEYDQSDAGDACCFWLADTGSRDSALGFFNSELIRWQVKSALIYATGTKQGTPSLPICIVFFSLQTADIGLVIRTKAIRKLPGQT
jgi:hypothetical protein